MLRSNVIDYAAIAMAESRNSGIFDQDYLAGITVLGLTNWWKTVLSPLTATAKYIVTK